jgi:hypothetical protein
LAIAALVTGCGGSDDGEGDGTAAATTSSITKPEFVKQATAICDRQRKKLSLEMGMFIEKHGPSLKEKEISELSRTIVLPGMETQIEEIRDLGAPASYEKQVEEFLIAWEGALEGSSNPSTPLVGERAERMLRPAAVLARQQGLGGCAYG